MQPASFLIKSRVSQPNEGYSNSSTSMPNESLQLCFQRILTLKEKSLEYCSSLLRKLIVQQIFIELLICTV